MLLLLVPFALALVVLAVLGLAGFGPITAARRADRDGLLGAVGPAVGLLLGVVLLAVSVLVTFGLGLRSSDDRSDEPSSTAGSTNSSSTTSTTSTTSPARRAVPRAVVPVATLGPRVFLETDDDVSFPELYDVVDSLPRETVLRMEVRGFEPFARAVASQCAVTTRLRCFNSIPVQSDEDGIARFQYLVTADLGRGRPVTGRCRADAAPCTVVVREIDGDDRAEIQTVFGEAIPAPGRITVTPATGLSLDGQTVTVAVRDYPPGATVFAMLCAAPDAAGTRCGAPGPERPLVVGADGTGSTRLVVSSGPVGRDRVPCTRGDDCGISVAAPGVFARAPVVPISFAGRGGPAYDPTRLALGLLVAAVLAGIGAWLILRTDWSAVGEAAAPEIDDAEYADLDAIVAALPPEEDELVSTR